MALELINVGATANDRTGDTWRNAMIKSNNNATELFAQSTDKRVLVKTASDLAGTLDSTVEYFIDGIIDMGSQAIELPAGGLNFTGYNFNVSKLISSA